MEDIVSEYQVIYGVEDEDYSYIFDLITIDVEIINNEEESVGIKSYIKC